MRTILSLAAFTLFLVVSAQSGTTDDRVAAVHRPESGHHAVRRWSGAGGSFGLGHPIAPLSLRAITWEFGDGSLSNILPPRPWAASDEVRAERYGMSPFREQAGGSPCVLSCAWSNAEGPGEPRAYVVSGIDQLTLVNTGMDTRDLRVRLADGVVADQGVIAEQCFTSGRWPLPVRNCGRPPRFIMLQDLTTGEMWCGGVEL